MDRKGEELCAQTAAGTKRVGDGKSDCVPEVPKSIPCKSNRFSVWFREEPEEFLPKDSVTSTVLNLKSREEKPPKTEVSKSSTAIRTLIAQWDNLRVVDGLLTIRCAREKSHSERSTSTGSPGRG